MIRTLNHRELATLLYLLTTYRKNLDYANAQEAIAHTFRSESATIPPLSDDEVTGLIHTIHLSAHLSAQYAFLDYENARHECDVSDY
jgi:hypothetical protein